MIRDFLEDTLKDCSEQIDKTIHKLGIDVKSDYNTFGIRCNKIMGVVVFIFGNYNNDNLKIYSLNKYTLSEIVDLFEEYIKDYGEKLDDCNMDFAERI